MFKICSYCKNKLSIDNFGKYFNKRSKKYYYRSRCISCYNFTNNESRKKINQKIKELNLKKCEKCKEIKELSEFNLYCKRYRRICNTCLNQKKSKICIKCNIEKDFSEFPKNKIYYKNKCKKCANEETRKKRKDKFSIYEQLEREGIYNE